MFEIENTKELEEWKRNHKCIYTEEGVGAIGGRLTYCFTPTSLGVISIVKCACGEEIDTTDYGSW